jgi:hypothetical protein
VNKENIRSFIYRGENVFLIDTILIYYQFVLPKPILDGRYVAFYDNDTSIIAYDYEYKRSKPNGHAFRYYQSGQLSYQAEFKRGKLNGKVSSYFSNGQLNFQGFYINGVSNGKFLVFYNDGKQESESEFKYGKQLYLKQWDCNGNLKFYHVY